MTIRDTLKDRESLLAHYEHTIALPDNNAPGAESELQEYLDMPRNVIERLTPEGCAEIAFRLIQFSFYIQRCINREKSIISWSENEFNKVISNDISQYDTFLKHEMKAAMIIKDNSVAEELNTIMTWAHQRIDRLTYLSGALKHLSDAMTNNQKAKQYGGH